ncbi:hypothetical protein EG329_010700 [Mollisiaceae sp. DMI_Dod_QoI]|nr:hypothetical protein EG329_010700 [Helotiales sp. DMI_Dod_QoI]
MKLKDVQRLELPPSADMHVHLRQGEGYRSWNWWFLKSPNLQPPITSVASAIEYQSRLKSIEPNVKYLMSLYLHPSVTPEVIAEAAAAGVTGVKMYPQGVTTNSDSGAPADFLEAYSSVFATMEQHDLVLNLHGEVPGDLPSNNVSREEAFLPELKRLHEKFPRLRCILEARDMSEVDPLAFCKPIPQTPRDRDALMKAASSGDSKFFFGSDSAPHPLASKSHQPVPAGVFTQPFATQLVILALEEAIERGVIDEHEVTQERLENFLSRSGRRFYKLPEPSAEGQPKIVLERKGDTIPVSIKSADGTTEIGLSRPTAPIFSLSWLS